MVTKITRLVFISFILVWLVFSPALKAGEKVHLTFDHFYDHEELTKTLKAFEKAYPQMVKVISLGKSYEGRDIWGVIINNPKTGPAEHKPGYYMDGNIHGNEIQGTEVVIYTMWYLLKNYGETELATRLLDEKAFYFIPTMNPDSRDWYINKVTDPNSPRSGLIPYDSDRDGVADEDGPEDLDGDGSITMMRKKDPNGNMKPHPDDPRILIPVRPGEKGEYILLGDEGIDNDGDGLVNEDGPGGYDMNRNYAYNWQPNYVQRGAGDYPFCFPETKATRDFLLAHPNIIGAQNFHNYGGMILRGPGAKNLGEPTIQDRRVYDEIGKKGEKILPGYRYIVIYKDLYPVYGGSVDFIYNVLGAYTFSNELDMDYFGTLAELLGGEGGEQETTKDEELQRWRRYREMLEEMFYHDHVLMGEQYTEWKPYQHPVFGDIEIGGVKKFGRRVPPLFKLVETCHRNAAFCLYHADQLPRLEFEEVKIEKLDGNLYQVDVAVRNTRVTPTISGVALQRKLHRVDKLKVEGKQAKLVMAGQVVDHYPLRVRPIDPKGKNFIWVKSGVPGYSRLEFRLLIEGKGPINLIYDSLKGGYYTKKLTLK